MPLFDTHCHVDLYPDYERLVQEIEQTGVYTVAVTNTPSVFRRCLSLTEGKRFLRAALGLHPELVRERHRELPLMMEMLAETKYIGEIGLDFVTKDDQERILQRKIFAEILDACGAAGGKVLTVHSRRAADEVVEAVGNYYPGTLILHWFSGSHKTLDKGLSYGFYFSVNPSMIASVKGKQIVAAMPRDRVLTETDGPFVFVDGRSARPHDVDRVVNGLAELWQMDATRVAQTLYDNLRRAFSQRSSPL